MYMWLLSKPFNEHLQHPGPGTLCVPVPHLLLQLRVRMPPYSSCSHWDGWVNRWDRWAFVFQGPTSSAPPDGCKLALFLIMTWVYKERKHYFCKFITSNRCWVTSLTCPKLWSRYEQTPQREEARSKKQALRVSTSLRIFIAIQKNIHTFHWLVHALFNCWSWRFQMLYVCTVYCDRDDNAMFPIM